MKGTLELEERGSNLFCFTSMCNLFLFSMWIFCIDLYIWNFGAFLTTLLFKSKIMVFC